MRHANGLQRCRQWRLLALLLLASGGCSGPPPTARCLAIGVDEEAHPLQIALEIENRGDAPLTVTETDLRFDWQAPYSPAGPVVGIVKIPDIYQRTYQGNQIPPGERRTIAFEFAWETPGGSQPLYLLAHTPGCLITLDNGETIVSPSATFLLRSSADAPLNIKLTPELVETVEGLSGWKSPAVEAALTAGEDSSR